MAQEKIQLYYLNLFQLLMNFIHALSIELHMSETDPRRKKSEVCEIIIIVKMYFIYCFDSNSLVGT
jgi:hypothetical protein